MSSSGTPRQPDENATNAIPAASAATPLHPAAALLIYGAVFITILVLLKGVFWAGRGILATQPNWKVPAAFGAEAVAAVGAMRVVACAVERRRMDEAGYPVRRAIAQTLAGCAAATLIISAVISLMAAAGVYRVQAIQPEFFSWLPLITFLFVAIAEETIFRGMLFRVLKERWGSLAALLMSSLIFGVAHLSNEVSSNLPLLEKLIGPTFLAFELGFLLAASYMATRALWAPIGIHWFWNYSQGPIYGTDVSGNGSWAGSLIHSILRGPLLLTGGVFGPEGSIACLLIGTLAGAFFLGAAIRAGQWMPARFARNRHPN